MTTKWGSQPDGSFIRPTPAEILKDINDDMRKLLPQIDLSPETPQGQTIGIQVAKYDLLWQALEELHNSNNPNTAVGNDLVNICEFNAVQPLKATNTTAYLSMTGTEGTVVKTNFIAQTEDSLYYFKATEERVITKNKVNKIVLKVAGVLPLTEYSILINSVNVKITSSADPTPITIATQLVDKINELTDSILVYAEIGEDGEFTIFSNNLNVDFYITVDVKITIEEFYCLLPVKCTVEGKILVSANTITHIQTTVSPGHLESITNFLDATPGRNTETSAELRVRRNQNIRTTAIATCEAIKGRLLQRVPGVEQVKVFENVEIVVDAHGRPPKSIEALVVGGDDTVIATEIWNSRSGGIQTYGNVSIQIYDSGGKPRLMSFSRPDIAYIWFRINIYVIPDIFPLGAEQFIKENIQDFGREKFDIGSLVLIQEFLCPIYTIKGILKTTLEMGKTYESDVPPTEWTTENIQLDERDAPNFDVSRIEVIKHE